MKRKTKSMFFIVILALALLLIYNIFQQQSILSKLNEEKLAYEKSISDKKDEIEKLKKQLEEVQTPYYMEKLARERLKMVRPDEIIFILENNK